MAQADEVAAFESALQELQSNLNSLLKIPNLPLRDRALVLQLLDKLEGERDGRRK